MKILLDMLRRRINETSPGNLKQREGIGGVSRSGVSFETTHQSMHSLGVEAMPLQRHYYAARSILRRTDCRGIFLSTTISNMSHESAFISYKRYYR